jgi:hypothetical protein
VIAALVFSAGEEIVPFAPGILRLLLQAVELPDASLKANAIDALSQLARFAAADLQDSVGAITALILRSAQTDDFEVRAACLSGLSNLLMLGPAALAPFAADVHALIGACIAEDLQPAGDAGGLLPFLPSQHQTNCLTNAIILIKHLFKRAPALLPADAGAWLECCARFVDSVADDLSVAAVLASARGALRVGAGAPFFEALPIALESASGAVIGAALRAVARLLDGGCALPPGAAAQALEVAQAAATHALICQEEDADDDAGAIVVLVSAYRFLAAVAARAPDAFPLDWFLARARGIRRNFERSQFIGVLRQFYVSNAVIPRLHKKFIIKQFLAALPICEGAVLAEPILAVRAVLEREPALLQRHVPELMQCLDAVLAREYNGEPHFWTTVTDAVSLLCTILRLQGDEFDAAFWLPRMLAALPVRGDEMEADNIYATVAAVGETAATVDALAQELIRVYAQTLAMKDSALAALHLRPETYTAIVAQLALLAAHPLFPEVVAAALPDEAARARFLQRTAPGGAA